jgi:plasmid stabilization system protein ParE
MVSADDADELRRKQIAQIAELQNDLDSATARLANLEKTKARLANEAEAARTEADILGEFFEVIRLIFEILRPTSRTTREETACIRQDC